MPVLIDGQMDGEPRKLVVQANRNGVLLRARSRDRRVPERRRSSRKQTWAEGLDVKGRPIRRPGTAPSAEGTLVYPGLAGATNWFSPSYSPQTGLFYLQAREDYAQTFYKAVTPYEAGKHFEGGNTRDVPGSEHRGVVKAIDALTGAMRWQFDLYAPAYSGVMSTAGGLVFGGHARGELLCARRRDRETPLALSNRRADLRRPDVVRSRWPPACRHCCRSGAVRVRDQAVTRARCIIATVVNSKD